VRWRRPELIAFGTDQAFSRLDASQRRSQVAHAVFRGSPCGFLTTVAGACQSSIHGSKGADACAARGKWGLSCRSAASVRPWPDVPMTRTCRRHPSCMLMPGCLASRITPTSTAIYYLGTFLVLYSLFGMRKLPPEKWNRFAISPWAYRRKQHSERAKMSVMFFHFGASPFTGPRACRTLSHSEELE
jgi:hypothetical protein